MQRKNEEKYLWLHVCDTLNSKFFPSWWSLQCVKLDWIRNLKFEFWMDRPYLLYSAMLNRRVAWFFFLHSSWQNKRREGWTNVCTIWQYGLWSFLKKHSYFIIYLRFQEFLVKNSCCNSKKSGRNPKCDRDWIKV